MPKFKSKEIKVAVEAVRKGALLAQEIRRKLSISPIIKPDKSPVTPADFAVQALIARMLEKHFPNDPLVAEESAAYLRTEEGSETLNKVKKYVRKKIKGAVRKKILDWIDRGAAEPSSRFWTLDPIDGTKGFIRGDQYAVALALIENGEVKIAVLGCPLLKDACAVDKKGSGSLVLAVKGKGTWVRPLTKRKDWKQLRVSFRSDPKDAILLRSIEEDQVSRSYADKLVKILGIAQPAIWMDSLAKYTVIASGAGDILSRIPTAVAPGRPPGTAEPSARPALSQAAPNGAEYIWDQAAGALAIEEAGGRITDLDGNPLDFSCGKKLFRNRGIVATNGHLHEKVLEAIKEIRSQTKTTPQSK